MIPHIARTPTRLCPRDSLPCDCTYPCTTTPLQQQSPLDRIWAESKAAADREQQAKHAREQEVLSQHGCDLNEMQQAAQTNQTKAAKLREMFADRPETAGAPTNDLKANPSAHTHDPIGRPQHYARWVIEPITFIMANDLPFCVGNVVKYVLRYDAKDGRKDLEKAKRYIDMMIEDMDRKAAGTATDVVGKPL